MAMEGALRDPIVGRRVVRELLLLRQLRHENIVGLSDVLLPYPPPDLEAPTTAAEVQLALRPDSIAQEAKPIPAWAQRCFTRQSCNF